MRKDSRHLGNLQLLAEDLLTLNETPNCRPEIWEAERPLLAAESLRASGRLRLRVRGESMLPTIWPGEVVEVVQCSAEEVRPDDVVLALRDGRFYLHRFVGRSRAGGLVLRGDSMPAADPELSGEALLGKVSPAMPLGWWSRAAGRTISRSGLALRFALKLHALRRRRREAAEEANALVTAEAGMAAARGQECPRHTILASRTMLSNRIILPGHAVSPARQAPELPHARA